jgi:hypothetical protein
MMLMEMGPAAAPAAPALRAVVQNEAEDKLFRGLASWALGKIDPSSATG